MQQCVMLLIVVPCIPDLYSERSFMYSPHKLASHMRKYSISARHGISYCTQHIEAYLDMHLVDQYQMW